MIKTYLTGRTFLDLLKMTYAGYNKESIGTMFGHCFGNKYHVESVIPAQKLKVHRPTKLEISANQASRLEFVVEPVEKLFGYFHSHCEHWNNTEFIPASLTPSDDDLSSLLDDKCPILLMMVLNETRKKSHLCIRDDYISGTFNGTDRKYHVRTRVYYKQGNRHKIGKISVPKRSLEKIFL